MQIPKRVREGLQVLAEDALIVVGFSLAVVGIVELSGWSSKALLQDYTPLLLAMFSIIVTVSALRLSIKEGRDRARQERDQGVMPILVLHGVPLDEEKYDRAFECYASSADTEKSLVLKLDNAGLGTALNITLYIFTSEKKYFRVYSEIHKLVPNEVIKLCLYYALPTNPVSLVSRCEDVYGNVYFYGHMLNIRKNGVDKVRRNDHILTTAEEQELFDQMLEGQASFLGYDADKEIRRKRH